jgi:uncharacterized protein YkwD
VLTGFLIAFLLTVAPAARVSATRISDADTVEYLSNSEKDLIREINVLRADPAKYVVHLEQMKKYYRGKEYKPPGSPAALLTNEGVSAVDEAIAFVRTAKAVAPYELSQGLSRAAKDHVTDLGKTGNSGHRGTDGSSTEARCNRYGTFSNGIGENIVYQSDSAREIVLGWLVDDGVASRGHRRNLLSQGYKFIGVAIGEKSNYGSMCVLTFAGVYAEMSASPGKSVKPVATQKSAIRKM